MYYYLLLEKGQVVGYRNSIVKIKTTTDIIEVDLSKYKYELKKIGVEYLTEEEKVINLQQENIKLKEENLSNTEDILNNDYRLCLLELGL